MGSLQFEQQSNEISSAVLNLGRVFLGMPSAELSDAVCQRAQGSPFLVVSRPANALMSAESQSERVAAIDAYLRPQIKSMRAPDNFRALAVRLIPELDPRGFLPHSLADLCRRYSADVVEMSEAIRLLHGCTPAGIGARNVKECLFLQMKQSGYEDAIVTKTMSVLDYLLNREFAAPRKILAMEQPELEALARYLRGLTRRPADAIPTATPSWLSTPDITVCLGRNGERIVELNKNALVRLHFHDPTRGKKIDDEIPPQLRTAIILFRALDYRNRTLLGVADTIVARQHAFFAGARAKPIPLRRSDIASSLGLATTTVGRAVAGKILQWDAKLFVLDNFLPSGIAKMSDHTMLSDEIQEQIQKLIAMESPHSVLSDGDIVAHLNHCGVDIARRTVAKYRGCLDIPPSYIRRRLLAQSHRTSAANV